jgi:hypothetical protein
MSHLFKKVSICASVLIAIVGPAHAQGTSCNDQYLQILKLERICAGKNASMSDAEIQREISRPVFTAPETKQDIGTCESSSSKKFRRIVSPPVGGPSCKQS